MNLFGINSLGSTSEGYIANQITAGQVIREYIRRGIQPDQVIDYPEGQLICWLLGHDILCRLSMPGGWTTDAVRPYINTVSPDAIRDDLVARVRGLTK